MKLLFIHGAPASGKLTVARALLQAVQGKLFDNHAAIDVARTVFEFGAPGFWELVHDVRCGVCGSFLFSVVREGKFAHVTLGSLVDVPSIRPSAHIYVGSKAEWEPILDDLPQHQELPR